MPSMMSGASRTLDLCGTFDEYNDSPSGAIADWRGLLADWKTVGVSIAEAMDYVVETAPSDDQTGSAEK